MWLEYDDIVEYYYARPIGFIYRQEVGMFTPRVTATYSQTYYYEWYYSLRSYCLTNDSWEYLQTYGALFFKWIPVNSVEHNMKKGDSMGMWSFSSLAYNKLNKYTEGFIMLGAIESAAISAAAVAVGTATLF